MTATAARHRLAEKQHPVCNGTPTSRLPDAAGYSVTTTCPTAFEQRYFDIRDTKNLQIDAHILHIKQSFPATSSLRRRQRRPERGRASFRCLAIADHVIVSRDATDVGHSSGCIGPQSLASMR